MKMEEVIGGQFTHGGTTYTMVEARYGGVKVWPFDTAYSYRLTNVSVVYANGNMLLASGSNYAVVYGDVEVLVNGVVDHTITNQILNITLPSGSILTLTGNQISAHFGTTPVSAGTETVSAYYSGGGAAVSVSVSYQYNRKSTGTPTYGPVNYGTPGSPYDYSVTLQAPRYDSAASAAPASGANISLSAPASHKVDTPWTQTVSRTDTWTSGAQEPVSWTESGTDTATVSDTASIERISYSLDSGITISGASVSIPNMGTTPYNESGYSYGRSSTFRATNGTATSDVTIYQAKNYVVSQHSEVETIYDYESQEVNTVKTDFYVVLYYPYYTTQNAPAPASGVEFDLTLDAGHTETVTTSTPWTEVTTIYNVWSSGHESFDSSSVTDSGTEVVPGTPTVVSDNYSVTGGGTGFTRTDAHLKIESEGTSRIPAGRSATFTATNANTSQENDSQPVSLTFYQEPNVVTNTAYTYDLSVEIQHTGNLPGTAGTYGVTYRSYRTTTLTYTSLATSTETSSYEASVSGTNCTPASNSVSGQGAFSIDVTQNPSTSQTRTISVTLTAGSDTASDSRTQEVYTPSAQNVATFKPYIFPYDAGSYIKGKVYYQFMIDSGSLTSGTLTGVNFCYRVDSGTKQTVQVGSFAASEHNDPTAFEPQGITIPTFSSGTIKAWFEVTGSKGGFDTINADENTYYYEITL